MLIFRGVSFLQLLQEKKAHPPHCRPTSLLTAALSRDGVFFLSKNTLASPTQHWTLFSEEVVEAATKVQATFRGTRDREWLRQEKLRQEEAATKILGRVEIEVKQNTVRDFCS